ncbi:GNAT family N-acetyltransferase [Lysobacter humi (ex Lee et al. 2017)]
MPKLRDTCEYDIAAITAIYAHEVREGTASYEWAPPDVTAMAARWRGVCEAGLPHRVACGDGRVVGYAYASRFRAREGYRWTVEDSVYVAPGAQARGVGGRLLDDLIERCTVLGYRQMIAVIGDASNAASIALHERRGFRVAARFPGIGWKHGRWLENVQMQRALGDGDTTPPRLPPPG